MLTHHSLLYLAHLRLTDSVVKGQLRAHAELGLTNSTTSAFARGPVGW
jgi:hypothetical protein